MENTYEEFKEWTGGEIDSDIQHVYKKAVGKLQERKPFEDKLVRYLPAYLSVFLCNFFSCMESCLFNAWW
jgi:hypothetical protein